MQEFICQYCGVVFHGYLYKGKPHKYCSPACHYADGRIASECPQCGKPFTYHKSAQPQSITKYCSRSCWYDATHTPHTCKQCGKPFTTTKYGKRQTFCSHPCYLSSRYGYHRDGTLRCYVRKCQELVVENHLCQKHLERQRILLQAHPAPELALKMRFDRQAPQDAKRIAIDGTAAYQRELRARWKLDVLSYYSQGTPHCSMCGFEDIRALCLDHIDNNGAEHRSMITGKPGRQGGLGASVYRWVKNNGYPSGFQVLCANCNMIKEHEFRRAHPERSIPKSRIKNT